MPFQPINYAALPTEGNPVARNLVQTLLEGFKAGQAPGQMARTRETEELTNALQKIKLGQAINPVSSIEDILKRKKLEADIAKTTAETNKIEHPFVDQWTESLNKARLKEIEQRIANARSPEELAALEIEKNKAIQTSKTKEDLTTTNKTANQSIIQSIDNTLPLIKDLKASLEKSEIPGQWLGQFFSPDQQAKYSGTVATITDSLVGALNLPKTNESIALVKKIVGRQGNESEKSYKSRLESLEKDLNDRRKKAAQALKGFSSSQESPDEGNEYYDVETGTWKKS